MSHQIRELFDTIQIFCYSSNLKNLLTDHYLSMGEDFSIQTPSSQLLDENFGLPVLDKKKYTDALGLIRQQNLTNVSRIFQEKTCYNLESQSNYVCENISLDNSKQSVFISTILESLRNNNQILAFLDAPG
ncbi:hypothetical protein BB558_000776 [Smittium angustum]|uniref:Uncharacterized protein n=1 Tax=Smittium angustum TaxID=133377 RepID=A0A2U1JDJ1_SMIAN|nr:hypothetical protein BB558_000776 [Smittium angustum]